MKKYSEKERIFDVRLSLANRSQRVNSRKKKRSMDSAWKGINRWLDRHSYNGLNVTFREDGGVVIRLPEEMNFSSNYDETTLNLLAIRKLSARRYLPRGAYKLASVDFDGLRRISTSAALVLTAELSKWDDNIRQRLKSLTNNWDPEVLRRFNELGFFDLFKNSTPPDIPANQGVVGNLQLVKYIKGKCNDAEKTRALKKELRSIVGSDIEKWTFLHSGLTEAITNVTHHAYPDDAKFDDGEKYWYLTGSYNPDTRELKIVFYDQGIGIPSSLPSSDIYEKVIEFIANVPILERKHHEVMLRAAVELERTRTLESDRGNGLQDLLEFIRQRNDGYLSIISLKGLYKFSLNEGVEGIKSQGLRWPVCGTLIIWKVTL